jgi:hypothetical protein
MESKGLWAGAGGYVMGPQCAISGSPSAWALGFPSLVWHDAEGGLVCGICLAAAALYGGGGPQRGTRLGGTHGA